MLHNSERTHTILAELQRHTRKMHHGTRAILHCPWHSDRTPSLIVNLAPTAKGGVGSYYCFGCRASSSSHGGWNGLATALGLACITDEGSQVTSWVPTPVVVEDVVWTLPSLAEHWNCGLYVPWPGERRWRGVPGWLMRATGAHLAFDERTEEPVALLPQWGHAGALQGAVKALCEPRRGTLKYRSSPGAWVRDRALYPLHLVRALHARAASRDLFLVEGPRDAIRLLGCGLPALALLGTNNWSDAKRDAVLALDPDRIFLALDNDRAGRDATSVILPTLEGAEVHVVEWSVEGDDPGACSSETVRGWCRTHNIHKTSVRDVRVEAWYSTP